MNAGYSTADPLCLIFFHHQTTTSRLVLVLVILLCLIFFHHQTTTRDFRSLFTWYCVLSSFIIKPQRYLRTCRGWCHCVLSSFIIKPQPHGEGGGIDDIVSYLLSSSNHNLIGADWLGTILCLIFFHHQTTTIGEYMNHGRLLCLIFFHHQTTTFWVMFSRRSQLCLIFFHHQTTTTE